MQGGIQTAGGIQQFQARNRATQNQDQLRALTGRVLAGGDEAQFAKEQLQTQFPQESLKLEQQQAQLAKAKVANLDAATQSQLKNFTQRVAFANTLPQEQIIPHLEDEIQKGTQAGRDMSDTQELVDNLKTNPLAGAQQAQETIKFGQQLGFIGETKADIAAAKAGVDGISEVQSSKILPGGLVQLVRKDGSVEVVPAGQADAELVKQAERRGAELQGIRASEREGAKGAQKVALNAFDQVGKIRQNITDLQEGIRLVREEGAETGPIADRVASFRAGTVKLNQLRSRLGLNVVGSVTFGALSEGELALAKDVALPRGLDEDEIVNWMEERITAQQKLAANMEEAAIFLSEPGKSVADLIRFTKERDAVSAEAQKQPAAPAQPAAAPTATKIGRFQVEVE